MMASQELINNTIDANDLWKGIGGHFDSLSQIIHELLDNSISNFRRNPNLPHHTILLYFDTSRISNDEILVRIEDTGSGIQNIDSAFTLGDKKSQETPLNEHGFGLKHALASANPKNDNWSVYTRTAEDIQKTRVVKVESSYKLTNYHKFFVEFNSDNYPSKLNNHGTGTIIEFSTSVAMFRSIGRYGTKDPKGLIGYLKENLGFVYSGIIQSGIAEIQIVLNQETKVIVNSIEPWWDKTIAPGNGKTGVDLGVLGNGNGTGTVILDYKFGTVRKREPQDDGEKILYYTASMKTSGVEIRLNGRVIKNNLLTEIWENVEQHNRFNNFLVIIDLLSDAKEALPPTRSSKNGFRQGDPRLIGLYQWIRTHCPEPYENKYNRDEVHLFKDLKDLKLKQLSEVVPPPLTVELQRRVLRHTKESIRIDLYVSYGEKLIIYEGKKGTTSSIDLYQLKLYWDACVIDGLKPTLGILLASEHTSTVQDLVAFNNSLLDGNGSKYNFQLKKWRDEGIEYPPKEL